MSAVRLQSLACRFAVFPVFWFCTVTVKMVEGNAPVVLPPLSSEKPIGRCSVPECH